MNRRRLLKKPPTWRQVVLFSMVFIAFCTLAWGLQELGLWPENWTVNPREDWPIDGA